MNADPARLHVRVLPWRLRWRKTDPDRLRAEALTNPPVPDDLGGLVIGLALIVLIMVAAPIVAVVIAALLFTVEVPLLIVLRFW